MSSFIQTLKGHPGGLYRLFCTEAMERFSYYGMRAILVLYLVAEATKGGMGMERSDALSVYAIYTSLVYLTPLIGGMLADKYLGARKAIFIGGIVMMLGEVCLMLGASTLNLGLALLILGNGFFKPNISTIVGHLYDDGDPRRDGAFTIFYMGINAGAFFSPLICGTLAEKFGYSYGFAAAAVGMAIGVIIFFFSQRSIGTAGFPPERDPRSAKFAKDSKAKKADKAKEAEIAAKIEREKNEFDEDIEVERAVEADLEASLREADSDLVSDAEKAPDVVCNCKGKLDENGNIECECKKAGKPCAKSLGKCCCHGDDAKKGDHPSAHLLSLKDWGDIAIYILGVIGIAFAATQALPYFGQVIDLMPEVVKSWGGPAVLVAAIVWLFWYAYTGGKKEGGKAQAIQDVKSVAVILILSLFVIFFWLGFEQAGGTMTLFAEQETDRVIGSFEIPASYFQSINPIFILLLAPAFTVIWTKLDSSKFKFSVVYKFVLGLVMLGLGFILLYAGWASIHDANGALVAKASPLILVGVYLIHTMGELCLSPIGLSLVTRVSPPRMVSLMMGVWFISSGGANYFAGNLEAMLKAYEVNIFQFLIVTSFVAAVLLLAVSPLLHRWMKE